MREKRTPRRGITSAQAIENSYVVEDRGYVTPCWVWKHAASRGRSYVYDPGRGKHMLAYRLSYEVARGPIPEGLTLDHLCRQTICINPDHLEPVTSRENRRRAGQVKLTEDDVREVRRLLGEATMSHRKLAVQFGVCKATITHINTRRNWPAV